MASFEFGAGHPFPPSTTVQAFEDKGQNPSGSPSGTPTASGVVSSAGALAISGLTEGRRYWATAQVSGVWVWVAIYVQREPEFDPGSPLQALDERLDSVESGQESGTHGKILSALDFDGVDPTGVGDSTTGLQAWLDALHTSTPAASTTRTGLFAGYLPRGTYRITAPLTIVSVLGLVIYGDGEDTQIVVDGTGLDCALDLDGIAHARFSDFTIRGNHDTNDDVVSAIHLHWSTGASRSTTQVDFTGVRIRNLKFVNGFAVELDNGSRQNDEVTFRACSVRGQSKVDATWWQAGFRFGSGAAGNVFANTIYGISVAVCKFGVDWKNTGGAVYGGAVIGCGVAFNVAGLHKNVEIAGLRVETSGRLLDSTANGSASVVTLKNIWYEPSAIEADGYWVQHKTGGSISIDHCIVSYTAGVDPKIRLTSLGSSRISATVDGLVSKTAAGSVLDLGTNATGELRNYVQIDSSGSAVAVYRGRVSVPQTIATDANFTLTPLTSPEQTFHTGTLTADRTVTLSTTEVYAGARFRIARSGGGAFNLNVGTGPLTALATNEWCEVMYDGSAWRLAAQGALA